MYLHISISYGLSSGVPTQTTALPIMPFSPTLPQFIPETTPPNQVLNPVTQVLADVLVRYLQFCVYHCNQWLERKNYYQIKPLYKLVVQMVAWQYQIGYEGDHLNIMILMYTFFGNYRLLYFVFVYNNFF